MRLKDTIQKKDFKILVVDDEQGIIDSLAIFLNQYELVRSYRPTRGDWKNQKWALWLANSRLFNDANSWR